MGDGTRFGEAYLGYKDRPEVVSRLHEIFYKYRDNMSHRNNIVTSTLPQPQVDVSCTLTQSISHESDDSGGAFLKDLSISTEKKPPPRSCVILINGFPGVGKFTIAKELQNSLPQSSSILIDNHQLIDPVMEKHPQRDAAHYEARKALRRKVFGDLSRTKGENEIVIMTGCWAKHKYDEPQSFNDVEAFEDHAGVSRARRVPLVTVSMSCDAEKNLERVESEERRSGEKTKLVDKNILSNIRRDFELLDMASVFIQGVSRWHLELDVTNLSPKEAAEEILKVLQSLE
jgi:broad-specificity NMP kinase